MTKKPPHLYHGSCAGISGDLTPRPQRSDANGAFPDGERHLVFATDSRENALGYTLKTPHMFSAMPHEGKNIFLYTDHAGWEEEISRSECALYTLPSDSFEPTLVGGTPSGEWKSKESVSPVAKERVDPEAVMKTGGQLVFLPAEIDRELWDNFMDRIRDKPIVEGTTGAHYMRELQDHGLIETHLNKDTAINPIEFPKSKKLSDMIKEDVAWLKDEVAKRRNAPVRDTNPSPPPPTGLPKDAAKKAIDSAKSAVRAIRDEETIHLPARKRGGEDRMLPR